MKTKERTNSSAGDWKRHKRLKKTIEQPGITDSSDSCSLTSDGSVDPVNNNIDASSVSPDSKESSLSPIALDCEMVGVGEGKSSALARCSIVNYDGHVIYDSYVKPDQEITDYRTKWSGIRPSHMLHAISFRKAKKQVKRLLRKHVLVGHALQSDLGVLKIRHPSTLTRDTAKFVPLRALAGLPLNSTPSLKRLTSQLFNSVIQENEHCSVEDARAAMRLYRLCEEKWEKHLHGQTPHSYLGDDFWPSWTDVDSRIAKVWKFVTQRVICECHTTPGTL